MLSSSLLRECYGCGDAPRKRWRQISERKGAKKHNGAYALWKCDALVGCWKRNRLCFVHLTAEKGIRMWVSEWVSGLRNPKEWSYKVGGVTHIKIPGDFDASSMQEVQATWMRDERKEARARKRRSCKIITVKRSMDEPRCGLCRSLSPLQTISFTR